MENDIRLAPEFRAQLSHAVATLREKAEHWDLCVFTRGGVAPTDSDSDNEIEVTRGEPGGNYILNPLVTC